jgi:molybdopterin-guanine dinucleotide biosynthesis protein A
MGGADKALLSLAGKPLVAHVRDRLMPQVDRVLISANGDPTRLAGLGCAVIADARPQGPLSGVLAALTHAAALGATHVVSTPVDTPFLPADLVARLAAAAGGGLAVAASPGGLHPASALWPVTLAGALAGYLDRGEARVGGFTQAQAAVRVEFADDAPFLNLNTPEDLARAEAILRGAA